MFGVVSPEDVASHTGLALLRAMIAGRIPSPPIYETLGLALVEVDEGRAVIAAVPALRHYNPSGAVHGGVTATLLDACTGCAVHATLAAGDSYATLTLALELVRPLHAGVGPVRAEGRVIHRGRTIATAEGHLRDRAGTLYAHATATCLLTCAPARRGSPPRSPA